ncbi:Intraflagellar transport protein 140-like protein [Hypsibius exemplaris]|uniref:Intraflagellar transport protein 140-like protein n=1 Tax=Hypsibius exemplaris TaxID=2072580 RepID=A0A9X6RLT1_HYPEX|nr:Intraflagellar transport protein 140-like protein [Hypsibius exemplaris]
MSLFVERRLALPRHVSGTPVALCWHPSLPLFACCTFNEQVSSGSVSFFDNQAVFQQKHSVKTRPSSPDCAAWHPTKRLLVVAWRDGRMCRYDLEQDATQEGSPSEQPVTKLIWHNQGAFPLCAIDKSNRVLIWNAEESATGKPNTSYDVPQSITSFEFLQLRVGEQSRNRADTTVEGGSSPLDFLLGCQEGGVYHLDPQGRLIEAFKLTDSVRSLSYYKAARSQIRTAYVITDSLGVTRYQISTSGVFDEKLNIVLMGKTPASSLGWMEGDTLAVASVESVARVWDLPTNKCRELAVTEFVGTEGSEVVRSIAVDRRSGVIMGVTNTGNVLFWRVHLGSNGGQPLTSSSPVSACKLPSEVRTLCPNPTGAAFLGATSKEVFIFQERTLAFAALHPLIAVQTSVDVMSVTNQTTHTKVEQKLKFAILGAAITETVLAVWGADQVCLYDISSGTVKEVRSFARDFVCLGAHGKVLVAVRDSSLSVLSSQGVAGKSELRIQPHEGLAVLMDNHRNHCVVGTSLGVLKLADLDKVDGKHWVRSRNVKDLAQNFARLRSAKVNIDGTFIAVLIEKMGDSKADSSVYVWDTERDSLMSFDCQLLGSHGSPFRDTKGAIRESSALDSKPEELAWDAKDRRLLCVHLRHADGGRGIATFFPTSEKGLLLNSVVQSTTNVRGLLLGCAAPFVYFYSGSEEQQGKLGVVKRVLPDFEGSSLVDNLDDCKTVTHFCYYSALGKIAEAVNAVKTPNASAVWNHLARLCVRGGKLEYAKMCLAKLSRADVLADLRAFSRTHPDPELQLGHLAALLQLMDVAQSCFDGAKAPELTLELQKASGDWNGLLDTLSSSTADRLRRRETLYSMAVNDVTFGDVDEAVKKFSDANCDKFDVPRLLLARQPSELRPYIDQADDRKLFGWYGHFLETQGLIDDAVDYYRKAGDLKSVVRTMVDQEEEALTLVRASKDKAAAFQLAHTLEIDGNTEPAVLIELYETASAYSSAIRICMENGLDEKLAQLAQKCEKPEMLTAAKFLEGKGHTDKAISIFHRAGQLGKATDLAFEQGYYGNIETISEDIDENSDPVLVERCVEYFAEHNQVNRAVNLLIKAKRLLEAVNLCVRHQMTLDSRLIDVILEQTSASSSPIAERTAIIEKLADRCISQGLYHEAARLLIEIKRPEAAMHALVKTGDIDAILRYIRIIRDPDALVVAGNNLQAQPWHQKRDIFDAIVLAYKRAGAQLYLASFYDSWGETACESGRYDVAVEAFSKSMAILEAVPTTRENAKDVETAKEEMDKKKKVVSYFVEVQREAESSPEAALPLAEELLKHCTWESGVRAGHVFSLLITAALSAGALPQAKKYLRKLQTDCPSSHEIGDFVQQEVLLQLQ